jgi:hypothetical protein
VLFLSELDKNKYCFLKKGDALLSTDYMFFDDKVFSIDQNYLFSLNCKVPYNVNLFTGFLRMKE